MDYMDKIVSQLEAQKPEAKVEPKPEDQQPPVVDNQQEPPVDATPKSDFDFDKEFNDLVSMFEKEKPKEPEKPKKKTVDEIVEEFDHLKESKKTIDNDTDFDKIVDELYDRFTEEQIAHRSTLVEKTQLEQMLEKERARNNELFDKVKEFERETKKLKTKEYPDNLQALVDYVKLLEEDSDNQYIKMKLVGEIARIAEPYTKLSMTPYINEWLGSGVMSETQGTQETVLPKQNSNQSDSRSQAVANSFML